MRDTVLRFSLQNVIDRFRQIHPLATQEEESEHVSAALSVMMTRPSFNATDLSVWIPTHQLTEENQRFIRSMPGYEELTI